MAACGDAMMSMRIVKDEDENHVEHSQWLSPCVEDDAMLA